ncbi:hypothetical protein MRX96_009771 [Rhipicephalus microplus]
MRDAVPSVSRPWRLSFPRRCPLPLRGGRDALVPPDLPTASLRRSSSPLGPPNECRPRGAVREERKASRVPPHRFRVHAIRQAHNETLAVLSSTSGKAEVGRQSTPSDRGSHFTTSSACFEPRMTAALSQHHT